ncbi:hypothetical protein C0991_002355 [Blastosporella zonata]|nr:hypothetical protein C0991_002355 [Blastosporella zonata]
MKRSPEPSRMRSPFSEYGYDPNIPDSRGEFQPSQNIPVPLSQQKTQSYRLSDRNPRFPTFGFKHDIGQLSYPESSQRTFVSEDIKPCVSPLDNGGRDDVKEDARSGHEARYMVPAFPPQNRVLSQPSRENHYITSPYYPHLLHSDMPLQPVPENPTYRRASSEASQSYLNQVDNIPQKPNVQVCYDSTSGLDSSVGANPYSTFDAENSNSPGTSHHSQATSSIPMSNDTAWSNASISCVYERAQLGASSSSTLVNDSDSFTATFSTSEDMHQRNRTAAAFLSSSTASDVVPLVKKKKSKMHQCEVCRKMFPRFDLVALT